MTQMQSLPEGWKWSTLGEATRPSQKRVNPQDYPDLPYIGMENVQSNTMQLLGTTQASQMKSSADSFTTGDVLYGRLRPYLNKVICPDFTGLCSTEFIVFKKVPHIYSKYLQYFLNSWDFVTYANNLNTGDRPRVKFEQFAGYPFPLPPMVEQERIVAKIEEIFTQLDAGTAALRRVQAGLRRYKASVLKAACEGRLVPQDPSDEPADELLRRLGKSPLIGEGQPVLPEGWCWCHLPDIGGLGRGKSKNRPRNAPFLYGGPYPFIQTGDIRQADGVITSFSQTYSEAGLKQSKLWEKGTLCITIAANIAETAVLGFDACFPDSIVGFVSANGIENRFIKHFIDVSKDNLERYAPATAQKNINLDILQKLIIPLPPSAEQQRIVTEVERQLSVVSEIKKAVMTGLARTSLLRKAILKMAFEGRLLGQAAEIERAR